MGADSIAFGGGICTGWMDMRDDSEISRNHALVSSGSSHDSRGGGAYVVNVFDVLDSPLEDNVASTIEVEEGTEPGTAGIGSGGALFFASDTPSTIRRSRLHHNRAPRGGGAIYVDNGNLTITATTLEGNETWGTGAAISSSNTELLLESSTVADNQARGFGVGNILHFEYTGAGTERARIHQSTIVQYRTYGDAGATILLLSPGEILNSTITENVQIGGVGGSSVAIEYSSKGLFLSSSVVSRNGRGDPASAGGIDALVPANLYPAALASVDDLTGDHNLVGWLSFTLSPGVVAISSDDPQLGPLTLQGGATAVMVPRTGSPAIDAGTDNSFWFDQRGDGYPRVQGTAADIGAVEADGLFEDGFED